MSENDFLQEIKEIFLHLTDQEPTPDEEIEARDQLIDLFENLKMLNAFPQQISLIEDIISKLQNWDTLDLWFKEVEGLKDSIDKFLRLTRVRKELAKVQTSDETGKIFDSKIGADIEIPQIDVSDIVFQVTEQFKGEIGNLKNTIEQLKKELESKEEKLQDISQKKSVQKIIPKKDIKLAPPEIKIPSIKRPEKAPHIKVHLEQSAEDIMEQPQPLEEEIEDIEEISEITEESLMEQIKSAESLEKPKISPVISEIPSIKPKSEIPFKLTQIPAEEKEMEEEEADLTPIPVEKPKIMRISEDDTHLTPLPFERPKSMKSSEIDTDLEPIPTESTESDTSEESISIPIPTETEEKPILTPIISSKPKISPISIEEIDVDTIKSSSTDLFNVLSSVASRSSEQTLEPGKRTVPESATFKVKKEAKIDEADSIPQTTEISKTVESVAPSETYAIEPEKSVEALPKDKDTLYQELIALEGRRYSLEKSYKDLSNSYGGGTIDEFEFNNRSEGLKNQLDDISARITKIRRIIASL